VIKEVGKCQRGKESGKGSDEEEVG